jgi:hypothetical protein
LTNDAPSDADVSFRQEESASKMELPRGFDQCDYTSACDHAFFRVLDSLAPIYKTNGVSFANWPIRAMCAASFPSYLCPSRVRSGYYRVAATPTALPQSTDITGGHRCTLPAPRSCWGLFPSAVRTNTLTYADSSGECWFPVPLPPLLRRNSLQHARFRSRAQEFASCFSKTSTIKRSLENSAPGTCDPVSVFFSQKQF